MLGLLSACGGDGASAPQLTATADTATVAYGGSTDLLTNDRLDGVALSASAVSVSIVGTLPTGVSASGGVVSVSAQAVPGNVSFQYRVCLVADPANCAQAAVSLTVPVPAITAAADSVTLRAGESADLLANDGFAGGSASAATVVANATATLPTGVTLSASGLLAVGTTAVAGNYAVAYRICQSNYTSNCASASASLTVPAATSSVVGTALDADTGTGVAGVRVTLGSATTTTDGSGNFTLSGVAPSDRASVAFVSTNYAESSRVVTVSDGVTRVQARLVRVAGSATVDPVAGGTATLAGSTAQVRLPAGGLQRADGSAPSGAVTVQLTPIDPARDSTTMPGDFTTLVSGVVTPIESFGALNVQLVDAAGVAVNLRSGQTATIRIPFASRNGTPPASVPLYYFDTASGRWVREGTATLAGSGTGRYYEGSVGHFSTWNADDVYNTVRISGCVNDISGNAVPGAYVATDGVDYSGTTSSVTDANGRFTLPMRRSSQATLVGLSAGTLSNTLRVGPFTADAEISPCLVLSQATAGVTMKLTWGERPSDLDSHLFAPDGSHVYYSTKGSLVAAPYANLDVDDTSSYGPEVVTLTRLMVGTYKYSVKNYSGYSSGPIAASGARVELNIPGRAQELYVPPASGETSSTPWWNLFELDVDARCNVTVRRVGTYGSSEPTAGSGTATYCTP